MEGDRDLTKTVDTLIEAHTKRGHIHKVRTLLSPTITNEVFNILISSSGVADVLI